VSTLLAGIAAGLLSDARPTGVAATDLAQRCAFGVVLTLLAAHAPRRVVLAVGVAMLVAGAESPAAIASAAAVGLLAATAEPPIWARVVAGGAISAAVLDLPTSLGGWAGAIAAGAAAVLLVAGLVGLDRRGRRTVLLASGGLVLVVVVTLATAGATLLEVPDHIRSAEQATDRGLAALNRGDRDAALTELHNAGDSLDAALAPLHRTASRPARAVPVVAQNLAALDRVGTSLDRLVTAVTAAAEQGDPSLFVPRKGRVDLTAVSRLAPELAAAVDAAGDAQDAIAASRGPYLLPEAGDKLDQATTQLEAATEQLGTLRMAAEELPQLLGAGGHRRAFIGFTTPSETRGSGGILGSFAELDMHDGQVDLVRIGRDGDLNRQGVPQGQRVLAGPPGFIDTWGRFRPQDTWQNVTASPDFPSVGQVIAGLYPQSGGREVDLVFLVDPAGLSALMRLSGPVTIPSWPDPITADNVVQVLGIDQYGRFLDNDDRVVFLAELARATFETLLAVDSGSIAGATGCLGPAAQDRHLLAWSADPGEQALFERLGADGALPAPSSERDLAGVVLNNAAGNKLDWFRSGTTAAVRTLDPLTGDRLTTLTTTLRNDAPVTGFPDYVLIGTNSNRGAPPGENRTLISGYGSGLVDQVLVDGLPVAPDTSNEAGFNVGSVLVDLPVGSSRTVAFGFRDRPDGGVERPLVLLPDPPAADDTCPAPAPE
jgi:hypothetical protein